MLINVFVEILPELDWKYKCEMSNMRIATELF